MLDDDERAAFLVFSVFRRHGSMRSRRSPRGWAAPERTWSRVWLRSSRRALSAAWTRTDTAGSRCSDDPRLRGRAARRTTGHPRRRAARARRILLRTRAGCARTSQRSRAHERARRPRGRPRQPADGLALLGGGRRSGAARRDARCALDAARRPRLVSRGDRTLERSARRALGGAGDGRAHRAGDYGADEPGSRADGDPRLHPRGRRSYAGALAQLEETGEPADAVPLLRSLASLYLYRADFDKGLAVGRRLLQVAELQHYLRSGRRGISASAPTSSRSAPSTRAWTISIARSGCSIFSATPRVGCVSDPAPASSRTRRRRSCSGRPGTRRERSNVVRVRCASRRSCVIRTARRTPSSTSRSWTCGAGTGRACTSTRRRSSTSPRSTTTRCGGRSR